MRKQFLPLTIILLIPIFIGWKLIGDKWISEKQNGYYVYYTALETENVNEYKAYFETGKKSVENFFQSTFDKEFSIFIHPSRQSLDSSWQKDWDMPGFNSQCWMVASGVSHKLDILSPKKWSDLACEHTYSDSVKTQALIAHELVHVYHGQQNKSPDFSNVNGIDWFVEGLAVYASGQCDPKRISEVRNAILENNIPRNLSEFWTGKLRYGLSGTVVMYLDKKYGREKLKALLKYNDIEDVLKHLKTNELEIVNEWKEYMLEL